MVLRVTGSKQGGIVGIEVQLGDGRLHHRLGMDQVWIQVVWMIV